MNIDRSRAAQALAKVIAYKQCGNAEKALAWTLVLLDAIGERGIVPPSVDATVSDEVWDSILAA